MKVFALVFIDEAGDEDMETLAKTIKAQANEIKEAQQSFLKEKTEREKAELLLNAFKEDLLPIVLKQLSPARVEVETMNIDKSSNKTELKDSTVKGNSAIGPNSTVSINKTKKPNREFLIGIASILAILTLGILFYFEKIDSVIVETDEDKTKLEIKDIETQTPSDKSEPGQPTKDQ